MIPTMALVEFVDRIGVLMGTDVVLMRVDEKLESGEEVYDIVLCADVGLTKRTIDNREKAETNIENQGYQMNGSLRPGLIAMQP